MNSRRAAVAVVAVLLASSVGCADDTGDAPESEAVEAGVASEAVESVDAVESVEDERAALAAASAFVQPVTETDLLTCQDLDGFTVHCGYRNPEDLVPVPDGSQLIVSEMGEFMLDTPGQLSLLDLATGDAAPLPIDWSAANDPWGEAGCPAPDVDAFSPHGIDLVTRDDGAHALLVVNHGGREAVEFFELSQGDDGWGLAWRGCARPPGDPFINDVAGLADGGFLVTHMWDKSQPFEEIAARFSRGENLGWVWSFSPTAGFAKLPSSDAPMPNGIALSADGSKVFVNDYLGNRTLRIDRMTGELEGSFDVRQPDNITVDADGMLWVASHQHDPIGQTCALVTEGPCLLPYAVVRADPETLETRTVLEGDGAPMGYSTVALHFGDRLYLGSAHGDRIVSRPVLR